MKAPAFQFYADDFIGGTVIFTAEDVGAYIRLLCYQWGNGSIPEKKMLVDRIAGCVVSDEVMAKFPNGKNARMESERTKQAEYKAHKSEAGKRGASSRWQTHGTAMVSPLANDGSPPPSPSPTPSPTKEGKGASARFSFSPKFPYPKTELEMYQTLEREGIEVNPDYDGNFFPNMEKAGWKIRGKPIFDWKATYKSRLNLTEPKR